MCLHCGRSVVGTASLPIPWHRGSTTLEGIGASCGPSCALAYIFYRPEGDFGGRFELIQDLLASLGIATSVCVAPRFERLCEFGGDLTRDAWDARCSPRWSAADDAAGRSAGLVEVPIAFVKTACSDPCAVLARSSTVATGPRTRRCMHCFYLDPEGSNPVSARARRAARVPGIKRLAFWSFCDAACARGYLRRGWYASPAEIEIIVEGGPISHASVEAPHPLAMAGFGGPLRRPEGGWDACAEGDVPRNIKPLFPGMATERVRERCKVAFSASVPVVPWGVGSLRIPRNVSAQACPLAVMPSGTRTLLDRLASSKAAAAVAASAAASGPAVGACVDAVDAVAGAEAAAAAAERVAGDRGGGAGPRPRPHGARPPKRGKAPAPSGDIWAFMGR
jgi:hypothetical protein